MDQQKLKFAATLPQKMAKLLHQNHVLKFLTLGAYFVCLISVFYCFSISSRGPVIVPLDIDGARVAINESSGWTKMAVDEAVKDYLSYRYSWNPKKPNNAIEHCKEIYR